MVPWRECITDEEQKQATVNFALGLLTARDFVDKMQDSGVHMSGHLKKHKKTYLRRLARKALKRRNILNHFNLVG